jgi:hypothetical protein
VIIILPLAFVVLCVGRRLFDQHLLAIRLTSPLAQLPPKGLGFLSSHTPYPAPTTITTCTSTTHLLCSFFPRQAELAETQSKLARSAQEVERLKGELRTANATGALPLPSSSLCWGTCYATWL